MMLLMLLLLMLPLLMLPLLMLLLRQPEWEEDLVEDSLLDFLHLRQLTYQWRCQAQSLWQFGQSSRKRNAQLSPLRR
jgi:hypothetical protein